MSITAVQRVGRTALDGVIEVVLDAELWSRQKHIARAISKPNARVVVPACWASGKSFLGGRIPLAYHLTYEPTPPDATKVVLTSSREDQLEDVLWSELRSAYHASIIDVPGHLPPREMRLYASGDHYIVGHSPARPEGLKGYHARNVLVVVDEGSYMPADMGAAVMSLVATGDLQYGTDARLLVLLNPSDSASWAAQLTESPHVTTIPITAFDTPGLSHMSNQEIYERWGEETLPEDRQPLVQKMPRGAALISAQHLDDMVARGNGPGSYEWETGVMARFWSAGSNKLITRELYDAAYQRRDIPRDDLLPIFYFGIDLASYGDSESVVAIRQHPNVLRELHTREKLLPEDFLNQVAKPLFDEYKPTLVVYDADGPGAGVARLAKDLFGSAAFGFRGSMKYGTQYINTRSAWWWKLRHRFLTSDITIFPNDQRLRQQMTLLNFDHSSTTGQLKVEDKHTLHRRHSDSIDRADAVMYAFAHDVQNAEKEQVSPPAREDLWGRAKRRQKAQPRSGYVTMPRAGVKMPRR